MLFFSIELTWLNSFSSSPSFGAQCCLSWKDTAVSLGLAWLSCFSTEQIFSSSQELWTIGQPALFNSFQMELKLSDVFVQYCSHGTTHSSSFRYHHLFQFSSIYEPVPVPDVERMFLWFVLKLKLLDLSNILKASLSSAELSWCSAWKGKPDNSGNSLNLLPHHLHELVKVKFPVSVHVVLNHKAQHLLPIDQRRVAMSKHYKNGSPRNERKHAGQLSPVVPHHSQRMGNPKSYVADFFALNLNGSFLWKNFHHQTFVHLILGWVLAHRTHYWKKLFSWDCTAPVLELIFNHFLSHLQLQWML